MTEPTADTASSQHLLFPLFFFPGLVAMVAGQQGKERQRENAFLDHRVILPPRLASRKESSQQAR